MLAFAHLIDRFVHVLHQVKGIMHDLARGPGHMGQSRLHIGFPHVHGDGFHPVATSVRCEREDRVCPADSNTVADAILDRCGYPERFAQQALGHNSKAVHHAYSKRAEVTVPSLEEWEKQWKKNPQASPVPKIV